MSQAAWSDAGPDNGRIFEPPPGPSDQPRPSADPVESIRTGTPVATAPPPRAAPAVPVEHVLAPETAMSPRFLPGSKAAGMPWLLPAESASPSGVAADQAVLGNLEVRAASVIGSGHRCEEPVKPRQDAYRVARDRNGEFLVVAVADGMSDSARSELGAATAVGTAVALVRRHLDERRPLESLNAAELFRAVSAALVQQAKDRGLDPNDVRTTLAVAVLPAYRRGGQRPRGWVGQIADTHLWQRDDSGWKCLTGRAKDSYNGNTLSTFLPHTPDAAAGLTFALGDGDTVAVLSDGVADAFSEVPGAAGWFAERWRRPPPLASFLLDVDFDARQQLDDRTAVVVWAGRQSPGKAALR
ncbi:protein phosphatase 2C domain-containing protein [Micromonospora sp. NPDC006766]|uniref:protein phosphatase 2C domain-containing protein n=1 Tax=Micromonospora sp. NPDC006766 TaxID=3154778 RepID=UPI0033E598E0